VLDYDAQIEVMPSVFMRVRDCTAGDLEMARECDVARQRLREQAEALLAEAHHHDITIPQRLRERLAMWSDDLPGLTALLDELHGELAQSLVC
jgi:hypothetical protein